MLGLGIGEVLLILVVGLLVLGPEKLPKVARQLGKGIREFRKAAHEFQRNFNDIDKENPPKPNPSAQIKAPSDTIQKSHSASSPADSQTNKPKSS